MKKRENHDVILEENAINIFPDGSSYKTPRRGGIGIVSVYVDEIGQEEAVEIPSYESYSGATNNQMELEACITALDEVQKHPKLSIVKKIVIHTDSMYVANNYNNARFYWRKNGWLTKENNPVENTELWKKLLKKIIKLGKRFEFRWVKGHAKSKYNKRADRLAKDSANSALKKTLPIVTTVRRKKTTKETNLGSVKMQGQKIAIRIIIDQYMRYQRLFKFKYEVVSKRSKYYGHVDHIYAQFPLKAGHEYIVTFNKNSETPRILQLIEEKNE